jgi:hypothetical protein
MSICRTSAHPALAGLLAGLLGLAVGAAGAQDAEPAQDPEGVEGAEAPIEAVIVPEAPPPVRRGGIVASELAEVDPFVVGALSQAEGALPTTLWSGSDLAGVAEAASRAPGETGFLAASQMAARALLSAGPAPSGPGTRRDAARERLGALLDLGRVDAVDLIVSAVPRGLDEPELAALAVQARLAKNQLGPACRVGDALTNGRDGAFWLRLRTACYAWSGESAAAQLTLDLAIEADDQIADEDFVTWIFAAASRTLPRNPPAPRDALEGALAQSAGYDFNLETLERLPLLSAVGLLGDDDVAAEVRALAALRAARTGAATPAKLAEALDELPAPPDASPAELIAAAAEQSPPAADALLRRAAMAENAGPYEAAQAIDAALARAQSPTDFILTARTLADALAALPASAELVDHAPRFALAAAAIGDKRLAYAWLDPRAPGLTPPSSFDVGTGFEDFAPILNDAPDFSKSPVDPAARVAAEVVVAAGDPRATPRRLADVALARLESARGAGEGEELFARRDALLLVALGAQVTPELRRAASSTAGETHLVGDIAAQALSAARLAADAGAVGETALYLALAAAEAGPGHAPTIASVIELARRVGLNEDARALAVEAMLASRVDAGE